MQDHTEIPLSELHQYSHEFEVALDAVCKGVAFRSSQKSCEFLRHIVAQTLNGSIDELKERLIGITLLGRETTYDTGSDAGVRVRASEVRKRLTAHNDAEPNNDFFFDLPPGSYVPRFFRNGVLLQNIEKAVDQGVDSILWQNSGPPLSLQRLAAPTLTALFFCVICLRWQIGQEHPFMTFWQHVFEDHHAMLYMSPTQREQGKELIALQNLRSAAPLLSLAGQFHTRFNLIAMPEGSDNNVLISIGTALDGGQQTKPRSSPAQARLTIENTPDGRQIFDTNSTSSHRYLSGRAALLTISNDHQHVIRIEGTDDDSIESLVNLLCERDDFPGVVADSFEDSAVTQIVFPMGRLADMRILREPAMKDQTTMVQSQ
jgi:hypothetical protein